MTTTISGTTGVTYPVQAGGTSQVQSSSGKVLQVVQGVRNSGYDSISSTSYVAVSGITATITPTSTTSKILIIYNTNFYFPGSIGPAFATVYRNGSNVGASNFDALSEVYEGGSQWRSLAGSFLDSPASTSALTYQLYGKTVTGTVIIGGDTGAGQQAASIITLMEIAA